MKKASAEKEVRLLDEATLEIHILHMYELSRWFPCQSKLAMYERALERLDHVRDWILTP